MKQRLAASVLGHLQMLAGMGLRPFANALLGCVLGHLQMPAGMCLSTQGKQSSLMALRQTSAKQSGIAALRAAHCLCCLLHCKSYQ